MDVGFLIGWKPEAVNAVNGLQIVCRDIASVSINGIVAHGMQTYPFTSRSGIGDQYKAACVFVDTILRKTFITPDRRNLWKWASDALRAIRRVRRRRTGSGACARRLQP